ncbi:MAG: copper chaperone PCu(A)C [Halioglobus sp.]|nr:copper chaperone PCu(A)C [Halioglobus sp.]
MFRRFLSALAAALVSVAVPAADEPDISGESGIAIESAWVRALPPTVKNTAAYLAVTNNSESAQAVVAARSDVAAKVEIHTTVHQDGMVRMQQLPGVALAQGETVAFAPGGTHLMLLGLAYPLVPGDEVELCLVFATGSEACTTAQVRRDEGGGHQHH